MIGVTVTCVVNVWLTYMGSLTKPRRANNKLSELTIINDSVNIYQNKNILFPFSDKGIVETPSFLLNKVIPKYQLHIAISDMSKLGSVVTCQGE